MTGLFSHPHLWFGVVCLFLYVGVEVMAGDAIGAYGRGFGLPIAQTALFTSLTLAAMLAGYVLGLVVIPRFVSQERYLAMSAALGVALVIGAYLTRDYVSVGFVAALGFANAMMWPAIFPLAIRGLGRHTATGSAMLIMAICGGAILPQLFAILKAHYDFQGVFLILMAPAYGYILFLRPGRQPHPRLERPPRLILWPWTLAISSAWTAAARAVPPASSRLMDKLIGTGNGGPANILLGLDQSLTSILDAIDDALASGGPRPFGVAGDRPGPRTCGDHHARRTARASPRSARPFASLRVATDAHVACLGAFSGRDGAIMIAGTGCAGYAWLGGQGHAIGCWGFDINDDVSAATLGRNGIQRSLNAHDGLIPATEFTHAMMAEFGGQPSDVVAWSLTARPKDYGALAPLVMRFAEQRDPVAVELVETMARMLERYIARLHDIGAENVCLVGGMARVPGHLASRPSVRSLLHKAEHDAVDGALLLARGAADGLSSLGRR